METLGRVLGGIGATVAFIAVVGAIVLGGWLAGWWFKEQNTEKQAHLYRKSYANQERLREDISEKISEVLGIEAQISELPRTDGEEIVRLEAQSHAIMNIACHDASQVQQGYDPEQESFIQQRCQFGSVTP